MRNSLLLMAAVMVLAPVVGAADRANQRAVEKAQRELSGLETAMGQAEALVSQYGQTIATNMAWAQQLQQQRPRLEDVELTLRRDLTAAVDRANQEIGRMGPRRVEYTAFGSRALGGPTDATEMLVASSTAQHNQAVADLDANTTASQTAIANAQGADKARSVLIAKARVAAKRMAELRDLIAAGTEPRNDQP